MWLALWIIQVDNHKTLRSSARNAANLVAGKEAGVSSAIGPIGPNDCISVAISSTLSEFEPTEYYPSANFDVLLKLLLIRIVTQLCIKMYELISRND
jgi:hypothetical protein